jgi:uncharacterized Zn finger protein (UPF0148 family)
MGVLVMTCARCGQESRARPEEALVAAVAQTQAEASEPSAPAPRSNTAPALKVVTLRPSEDRVREAAALARSEDPFAVPAGFCPKCISVRKEGAESCAACGLMYAIFDPSEQRVSEPLRAAWLSVLERWDDRDAHDRLLSLAVGQGELAAAGRLYRIRLAQAPDDVYAQRGRDEVLRLATASQAAFKPTPTPSTSKAQVVGGVLLFLLVMAMAFFIFRQFRMSLAGP